MKIKMFFLLAFFALFCSCSLSVDNSVHSPGDTSAPGETDVIATPIPVASSYFKSPYLKMDEHRTNFTNAYWSNVLEFRYDHQVYDLDGDGIANIDDPAPLDNRFPGLQLRRLDRDSARVGYHFQHVYKDFKYKLETMGVSVNPETGEIKVDVLDRSPTEITGDDGFSFEKSFANSPLFMFSFPNINFSDLSLRSFDRNQISREKGDKTQNAIKTISAVLGFFPTFEFHSPETLTIDQQIDYLKKVLGADSDIYTISGSRDVDENGSVIKDDRTIRWNVLSICSKLAAFHGQHDWGIHVDYGQEKYDRFYREYDFKIVNKKPIYGEKDNHLFMPFDKDDTSGYTLKRVYYLKLPIFKNAYDLTYYFSGLNYSSFFKNNTYIYQHGGNLADTVLTFKHASKEDIQITIPGGPSNGLSRQNVPTERPDGSNLDYIKTGYDFIYKKDSLHLAIAEYATDDDSYSQYVLLNAYQYDDVSIHVWKEQVDVPYTPDQREVVYTPPSEAGTVYTAGFDTLPFVLQATGGQAFTWSVVSDQIKYAEFDTSDVFENTFVTFGVSNDPLDKVSYKPDSAALTNAIKSGNELAVFIPSNELVTQNSEVTYAVQAENYTFPDHAYVETGVEAGLRNTSQAVNLKVTGVPEIKIISYDFTEKTVLLKNDALFQNTNYIYTAEIVDENGTQIAGVSCEPDSRYSRHKDVNGTSYFIPRKHEEPGFASHNMGLKIAGNPGQEAYILLKIHKKTGEGRYQHIFNYWIKDFDLQFLFSENIFSVTHTDDSRWVGNTADSHEVEFAITVDEAFNQWIIDNNVQLFIDLVDPFSNYGDNNFSGDGLTNDEKTDITAYITAQNIENAATAGSNLFVNKGGGASIFPEVDGKGHEYTGVWTVADLASARIRANAPYRPGDDYRIRVKMVYNGITAYQYLNDASIVAVYDEIMLSRAREYCNNDNGISDWTKFNDDDTVTDAVAYTWGGTDDIDTFNDKLSDHQNAITAYFTAGQAATIGPNPDPANHRGWSPWNTTTAPGDDWDNYLFTGNINVDNIFQPLTIGGVDYYPYRPGFSSYRNARNTYNAFQVFSSAGIDCSGFVQRVASYTDNDYDITDFAGSDLWTRPAGSPVLDRHGSGGIADRAWLIDDDFLSRMVPGDIMYTVGHIVIVLEITYPANTRDVANQSTRVRVIEATQGLANEWQVMDSNYWSDLIGVYSIRRLKQ